MARNIRARKAAMLVPVLGVSVVATGLLFNNCSGGSSSSINGSIPTADNSGNGSTSGNSTGSLPVHGTEANVLPITMNSSSLNIPTVAITVCMPGSTTNCQYVDNVLLDTGSTGLRIFSDAIPLNLPQVNTYAECYQFGSGLALWGPISTADITLGGEKISGLELQVINSSYLTPPTDCTTSDGTPYTLATGPSQLGWNGVLGIQQFAVDCGSNCSAGSTGAVYYTCSGSTCTDYTMPASSQLPNPIAALPADNNGFAIQSPSVPATGASSLPNAYLILGIGTASDNTPPSSGVQTIALDSTGSFTTQLAGQSIKLSVIDSGSYDLEFPQPTSPTIPTCNLGKTTSPYDMYCPSNPVSLSATLQSASGQDSLTLNFQVYSGQAAWSDANNYIFNDIADPEQGLTTVSGAYFVWGFPIFLGRTIYFGMDNATIPGLGAGPFDAI